MKIYPLFACCMSALIGLSTFQTSFAAESLFDIYQQAVTSAPDIKAAEAAYMASREAMPQSRALLLPDVNITGSASRNEQDVTKSAFGSTGVTRFTNQSYTLQVSQPLYRQERFAQFRQAKKLVSQAEAEYQSAQQALMIDVASRYFSYLGALDNLEFAQAEKDAIKRQLDQAQQRFDVGLIAITDVHEARASYDLAVAQEIVADNLLASAQEALTELTGRVHKELRPLRQEELPLVPPQPEDIEHWVEIALQQSPPLIASRFASEVARDEIKKQNAGHMPALDLIASYGVRDTGGNFSTESEDAAVGLQLNIPLYQGGGTSSRVREASYRHEQALEQLEAQRRKTLRETRNNYLTVLATISQVKALKQAEVSNQSALKATEAGFEVGTRTTVDVLDSRRGLFRAKRDYARARYDYLLNSLKLFQAAGTLTESDIQTLDTWLQ